MKNPSRGSDPVEVWKYQLDGVKGAVHTTQKVTIPPFQTINIKGNAGVKGHCMKVHVLTEPALGPQLQAAVVPIVTYGELHPGSSRVPICLDNMSPRAMEIPGKTVVGQVIPANQVAPVVHPTRTTKETTIKTPKGWVLEALDLQGLKEWPESEQKQARELLLKWEHLFAGNDLDLGKTALIKHKIRLTDQTPFKERYRHIPPHMYDEHESPYPRNVGYWCYLQITQSVDKCSGVGLEKGWWPEVLYRPQEAKRMNYKRCLLAAPD